MKRTNALVSVIVLLGGLGSTGQPSAASEETADIWTAAAKGNLEAVKQQLAQGKDVNAKAPSIGATPLMTAAITGQGEAVDMLLADPFSAGGATPHFPSDSSGSRT